LEQSKEGRRAQVKNVFVAHLTKCSEASMVASVKIAKWLSAYMGAPLLDTTDKVEAALKQKPRAMLLVNSPTGFAPSEMRWAVAEMANKAEQYIFVNNDYKMLPPSQVQRVAERLKRPVLRPSVWSTVPTFGWKQPQDHYVNWNQLTYNPLKKPADHVRAGLFYWGALRQGREEYFAKYLNTTAYPVAISTPKVSWKKWFKYVPEESATFLGSCQNLIQTASEYQATIYIEDKKSHSVYCSPANRFYEAISAKTLLLVDRNAANTLVTAGVRNVEPFVVGSDKDVRAALKHRTLLLAKQKKWHADYRAALEKQTYAAITSLKKALS
jgi:hypothetical protein